MDKKIVQKGNKAGGDIVAGDKIVIRKQITQAKETLREELNFDPQADAEHTVLSKKLKDGQINQQVQRQAVAAKLKTLKLLLRICKTGEGKRISSDIYENLVAAVTHKYAIQLADGELLKTKIQEIYQEFSDLVARYQKLIPIDDAFLVGLLYIATSNCAIRWKMEDAD